MTDTHQAKTPLRLSTEERTAIVAVLRRDPEQAFTPALAVPTELARLARRRAAALNVPKNTRRAWEHDWQAFLRFCDQHATSYRPAYLSKAEWAPLPAPPELIVALLEHYSEDPDAAEEEKDTRKPATLRRYLATIGKAHRLYGLEDPTKDEYVRQAAQNCFRGRGEQAQATPIHWVDVAQFLNTRWANVQRFLADPKHTAVADTVRSALRGEPQLVRAQALLAVGYNTMARREELVALDIAHLHFNPAGDGTVTIRKSKTDQAAEGQDRYLSETAVQALRAWLALSGIQSGPLFTQFQRNGQARLKQKWVRSERRQREVHARRPPKGQLPKLLDHGKRISHSEVNRTFKAAMLVIGYSAVEVAGISGHSTRVGAAKDIAKAGGTMLQLMHSGGWKDPKMPARYTRKEAAENSGMAKLMRGQLSESQ